MTVHAFSFSSVPNENGILFSKLFLSTVRKNCGSEKNQERLYNTKVHSFCINSVFISIPCLLKLTFDVISG